MDSRDATNVAAAVLTGVAEADDGGVCVLTGPEPLSFADVADRILAVFPRTVTRRGVSRPPVRT